MDYYIELNTQQKNNYWKIIQQFNDLYPDGNDILDSGVCETIKYLVSRLPLEYTWGGGWEPRVKLHEKSTGDHLTLIWYQKHNKIENDVRCLFISISAKSPYLTLTYYDNYTKQMFYVKGHEVELYMDMNLETLDRTPKKIIDILANSEFSFCDQEEYTRGINNKLKQYKEIEEENKEKEYLKDKKEERISWDDYFMEMCDLVAKRSTCLRRQIGAVIVKDHQVLATGYNGAPTGTTHCSDLPGGCMREKLQIESGTRHELCRACHSEQSAITQAAKHGVSINGATLYCNTRPCSICARLIINSGIRKVYYRDYYPDEFSDELLKEAGVELVKISS